MLLKLTMSRWTVPVSLVIPAKRTRPLLWIKIFLYSYPKLVETYRNQVLQHRLTIKNPDMIYLLTNVAKTHDVLLDGTIFFDNTGQKDKATLSNKKVPIELS